MTLDELRTSTVAALSVTLVSAVLDVDERTVRRACRAGQLPCISVGRRMLIPREQLLELLTVPSDMRGEPREDSASRDDQGEPFVNGGAL